MFVLQRLSFDIEKLFPYMVTFRFICQCRKDKTATLVVFSQTVRLSSYKGLTSCSCSFTVCWNFLSCVQNLARLTNQNQNNPPSNHMASAFARTNQNSRNSVRLFSFQGQMKTVLSVTARAETLILRLSMINPTATNTVIHSFIQLQCTSSWPVHVVSAAWATKARLYYCNRQISINLIRTSFLISLVIEQ